MMASSMVVKESSTSTQVASLPLQEKGSRNKRKFYTDTPLTDPCQLLCFPSDCPDYDFPADESVVGKYRLKPVHGEGVGCDLCGVNGEHSDALKLDLGLSSSVCLSDLGASQLSEECQFDDFHDMDWSDITETQLEELVLTNLDAVLKSAIQGVVSKGYTEDVAITAVLRSDICHGSEDILSNIVDNALAYLKNGQEVDPSLEHCFEDLQQLERYILVELVCILQAVRPYFTTGDAMWCLLLYDLNVAHACAMDGDPLINFLNDGVSDASSITVPKPDKDANPVASSKLTPKVASKQGTQSGKKSSAGSLNLNKQKTYRALYEATSGKGSLMGVSISVDKPIKATVRQKTSPEVKHVPSRKPHSNSTKRESALTQKSSDVKKNHRTYDTKGASRAPKLSAHDDLKLDTNLRESAGFNPKNASIRMKARGLNMSIPQALISQANSTLSLFANAMQKSVSSSSLKLDTLTSVPTSPKTEKPPIASVLTSKFVLSAADTELTLSLSAQSNPPQVALNSSGEVPNCSNPVVPFDEFPGQWVPQDKKDEMIIKLYPRMRELQHQLHEWSEWANNKVMQATRRLSKDKAEIKMLRQEKEDVDRSQKERQTLECNTTKKLSEMENALSKASGQVERVNSAVQRLEAENITLRQEMEAAKLRATESAASSQEGIMREKMTLTEIQSWEKQKIMFQGEFATERSKLTQLQNEVNKKKDYLLQLKARWKQEEKVKDEVIAQAHLIRTGRVKLEASAKLKEDTLKSKADANLQRYKDDIKKLEQEISQLRMQTNSSKIATLKMWNDGSYQPNKATPAKTFCASESQSLCIAEMNPFQDESSLGGLKRDRECVMCLSEEISVVFLPCAHQVLCRMCNELHEKQGMKDCPSCRSAIQRRIIVRYADPFM